MRYAVPVYNIITNQGRIRDFKLGGGAHFNKLRRAEGGAKIFGVFRVKNHDFTPKNHIFSNYRGRRENVWGIPSEKSRFYAHKSTFFPILEGGGGARRVRPLDPPLLMARGKNDAFLCCVLHSGTWYDWECMFLECLGGGESLSLLLTATLSWEILYIMTRRASQRR